MAAKLSYISLKDNRKTGFSSRTFAYVTTRGENALAIFLKQGHYLSMAYNKLTEEEKHVIEDQGTERPFSGEYDDFYKKGVYVCRRCNNPLFESKAKFDAKCGWPAFDEHFEDAVKWLPDEDGHRTEIRCNHCDAHLGHVFEGEHFTEKNTRHCVNSLSIKFIPEDEDLPEVLNK